MSDYHLLECDKCGETTDVSCSARVRLPQGWERRGNDDWCRSCVDEEAEEQAEKTAAREQEAASILEAS